MNDERRPTWDDADCRAFNEMKLRAETAEARLAALDETPVGSHHGDPI